MKIKKNDNVLVISGKDRLKQGKIVQTIPAKKKVIISGINIVKKSVRNYEDSERLLFSFISSFGIGR